VAAYSGVEQRYIFLTTNKGKTGSCLQKSKVLKMPANSKTRRIFVFHKILIINMLF